MEIEEDLSTAQEVMEGIEIRVCVVVTAMAKVLGRARRVKRARQRLERPNRASRLDPGRPQWSCDRPWRRRGRAHLPAAGVNGNAGPGGRGNCRVSSYIWGIRQSESVRQAAVQALEKK